MSYPPGDAESGRGEAGDGLHVIGGGEAPGGAISLRRCGGNTSTPSVRMLGSRRTRAAAGQRHVSAGGPGAGQQSDQSSIITARDWVGVMVGELHQMDGNDLTGFANLLHFVKIQ
jgi:hypothetical protein